MRIIMREKNGAACCLNFHSFFKLNKKSGKKSLKEKDERKNTFGNWKCNVLARIVLYAATATIFEGRGRLWVWATADRKWK